ncbi:dolichol kinase [Halocatena halophila]|uniref:dolichol kinase n=1 Tax=Halocatena halophila TaxID=2814576 RepID=UPI002ED123B9
MHPEEQRRLVHCSGALVPLGYLLGMISWRTVQLLFAVCSLCALCLEWARLSEQLELGPFASMLREYERDGPAGYLLYFLGTVVVVWTVSPTIAVPSLLVLMVADPLIGVLYSGGTPPSKPAHVLAAMFVVSWLLAIAFVGPVAAICGAIGATIADGKKPIVFGHVIDDNLSIPPLVALGILLGDAVTILV